MEYKQFAKYYDMFYQKKDYQKEVEFLSNFIKNQDDVIDIGCGTGIHASLLTQKGANVDGLDLNKEMLDIAKTRLKTNLYLQNILELQINKKYNVIISMFAVLNHLKNKKELEKCFANFQKILKPNGKIIIDLHNPQTSGTKTDSFNNMKRTMKWEFDQEHKTEKSEIIFEVGNEKYIDNHIFYIFSIDDIKECALKAGLKVLNVFENYDCKKKGISSSKNLQFLIVKKEAKL